MYEKLYDIYEIESEFQYIILKVFELRYPVCVDNADSRRSELLNENCSARHGNKLLVRETTEVSKTARAIAIAPGYSPL